MTNDKDTEKGNANNNDNDNDNDNNNRPFSGLSTNACWAHGDPLSALCNYNSDRKALPPKVNWHS